MSRKLMVAAIIILFFLGGCIQEKIFPFYGIKYKVKVVDVIDGDTIDVLLPNGSTGRVRLLGVDTPETRPDMNRINEYDNITDTEALTVWGEKAEEFAKSWLENQTIYIQFDKEAGLYGYYGRLLAYVYMLNGTDFNAELLRRGYARVYVEGNFSKKEEYLKIEKMAMENKTGLWSCMLETGVIIAYVHYNAAGDDRYNLNDEYVIISNNGNTSVNLTGYTLSDEANHTFVFPDFVLESRGLVTIHTGSGNNTDDELYWGSEYPVWNNDHDTAYLRDAEGELLDTYTWGS